MEAAKNKAQEIQNRLSVEEEETALIEARQKRLKPEINNLLHTYLPPDLTLTEMETIACVINDMIWNPKNYLRNSKEGNLPPLKSFADTVESIENYKDDFINGGTKFKVGDSVYGTWVNHEGRTFYTEGVIISNPITGLWVEGENGITEVKRFWTLQHLNPPKKL